MGIGPIFFKLLIVDLTVYPDFLPGVTLPWKYSLCTPRTMLYFNIVVSVFKEKIRPHLDLLSVVSVLFHYVFFYFFGALVGAL